MTFASPIRHKPRTESRLTISRAAQLAGLTIRAVRLYEERGLVSSQRDASDNRSFGAAELERLIAIADLRTVGASLDEISGLVAADALVGDAGGSQELADLLNDHHQRLLHRLSCLDAIARRKGIAFTQGDRHSAKARGRRATPTGQDRHLPEVTGAANPLAAPR